MRTPARIATRFNPMLVPIPIGLWLFSLLCDEGSAAATATP